MRFLFTALLATLFLTGCPEDKKDDGGAKGKSTSATKAKPKASAEKKETEEGGW